MFDKVVGCTDEMDVDDTTSTEKNSGSAGESKSNAKTLDSDKGKGKRKLYVGSQALGFRRDNMEVSCFLSLVVIWNFVAVFYILRKCYINRVIH